MPAIVGEPDAFLRDVHQLLEPLLAFLQRDGAVLEPGLAGLEGRGVLQRGAHQAAEQAERLGIAVAEGGGPGRQDLEGAQDPLIVAQRDREDRADALAAVRLVADARVGEDVVASAAARRCARTCPRGCSATRSRGLSTPICSMRHQLVALERLDHHARGTR